MKRFNTDIFVNIRLAESLCSSKYFDTPGNNFSTSFVIKHYAGNVAYDTRMMLYKNRDTVYFFKISLYNCNCYIFPGS